MTIFDSYLLRTRKDLQEKKMQYEIKYGEEKALELIQEDIDKLKASPTSIISDSLLKSHKTDLQSFYKYIRNIIANEPEITNEELSSKIHDFLQALNIHFANSPSIRSDSIRVDMCYYYMNHQLELREKYREFIKKEKETGIETVAPEILTYSSNINVAKDQLMSQLITTFRGVRNSFDETSSKMLSNYCRMSPKQRRDYLERLKVYDLQQKKDYQERKRKDPKSDEQEPISIARYVKKNYIFFLPEEDGILEFLRGNDNQIGQYQFLSSELRKDYTQMILSTLKILDDFGFLDVYLETHNKQYKAMGLDDLVLTKKDILDAYSGLLEDSNSKIPLLSMYQYSVLNSFWINRLTHELQDFNSSYFTVESLDLWEKIRNAKTRRKTSAEIILDDNQDIDAYDQDDLIIDVDVSDDDLRAVLENRKYVSAILSDLYSKSLSNLSADDLTEEDFVDPQTGRKYKRRSAVTQNIDDEMRELSDKVDKEYRDFFGKLYRHDPEKMTSLFSDIYTLSSGQNATHNSFSLKSNMQIAQMSNLYNNVSFSKNWGLYLEGRKNPLETDKIIIAIDAPGFNMPIRLHLPRELVIDFLKANQGTTKIPLYQGEKDFYKRIDGKRSNVSTPLLMPLDLERKSKFVKALEKVPASSRYYNFARHLIFTTTGNNLPDHMKDELKGKKKGKKKFSERYFDFADGKIYVKTGSSAFKEDPDYVVGGFEHGI